MGGKSLDGIREAVHLRRLQGRGMVKPDKILPELPEELRDSLDLLTGMFRDALSVALASAHAMGFKEAQSKILAEAERLRDEGPPPRQSAPPEEVEEEEGETTDEPLPDLVDCATLPPLTPIQFKVFSAFVEARGKYLSSTDIDRITGHTGAYGNVYSVAQKGYIIGRHAPGLASNRKIYHVACFGTPRVLANSFEGRGKSIAKQFKPSPPSPPAAIHRAEIPKSEPAPAPAPIIVPAPPVEKKHYPSLAEINRAAANPRRVPMPAEDIMGRGSDHFGDPQRGRSAAAMSEQGGIKVSTYLIRKGHTCVQITGGWMIDGKFHDVGDALMIVNQHRRQAELPDAIRQDLV